MKLTVVGCSPAWPNPGGAQSGYLVEGAGRLLLDCGPGVLARLRETEGWPRPDAIAITHLHLDHWGDLVPWAFGHRFGAGHATPVTELWLPPGGRGQLEALGASLGFADAFREAFAIREYAGRTPFRASGLTVTAAPVQHYAMPTFALRVEADGPVLAYSADSAPCEGLVETARDADLFLCEATLAPDASEGEPRGHLSAEEAVAAFEAAGARRLLLTHRPVELPVDAGLELARDGLVIEV